MLSHLSYPWKIKYNILICRGGCFLGSLAGKKFACNAGDPSSIPGSGSSPGEGIGYSLQYSLTFLSGSDHKESACSAGDLGSTPGLGRSPGGRHDNPLQQSCLENPHGQRSRMGYSPLGYKESDMIEGLSTA